MAAPALPAETVTIAPPTARAPKASTRAHRPRERPVFDRVPDDASGHLFPAAAVAKR